MIAASPPLPPDALATLLAVLRGRRIAVLAGAGCSTESGIPDYRGPTAPPRRNPPLLYQEFVRSEAARARYWARSTIGWPRIAAARPNPGHLALARLEAAGAVCGVITQNVDGLHHAAGSRAVTELHGSLAAVRCIACGAAGSRAEHQQRILALNAAWAERVAHASRQRDPGLAPDGDVELPDDAPDGFRVPGCDACGGVVKPDVVLFGENVPKPRVEEAWQRYGAGEALLVVGSSLSVFSGRRFVYRARDEGVPIAIVNIGPTRADELAAAKVEAPLGTVLPLLADALATAGVENGPVYGAAGSMS